MSPLPIPNTQWNRIQEIFSAAADLPRAEQSALLDSRCGGEPLVREEVESLLRADASGDADVLSAIGGEADDLLRDAGILGSRLGDYRVIRELGQGGMGTVYLAERDDENYRKQVAIKVVRRGMDTDELLGRFRHERQILANLDHPYIARLIDGGSTTDGRPFLVMDYVQGQPIDAYCVHRNLDIPSRLRLFIRVCEAVAEAHRNLIVHRDLKPGNILVTAEGVPKLLDFGVARLLEAGTDPAWPATAGTASLLTPEYASPEQVLGLPATTSIDVYALGVVLYEVLTGVRPQKMKNRTPAEVDRVVCQTEVRRPSTVVTGPLGRQLLGDLDNIVLMAMQKEKSRRYASVDLMAEDIRRHLAGLPVMACRDSLTYRASKHLRRHRWAVAAACLVAGSLIAGAAVATLEAGRARAARVVAEAQRQAAETQRRAAESERKSADRERLRAEAETRSAQTERDRAARRLTEMVTLADHSLFDVDDAIARLPGTTAVRRQVVASTLRFLEKLPAEAAGDERLQYLLSVAYLKIADAQGYPLLPNLGDRAGALTNYHRAMQWNAPLLAQHPDNAQYLSQAVRIQTKTGAVLSWEGRTADALAMQLAALPAAQRLALMKPRELEFRLPEAEVYSQLASAYISNDVSQFLAWSRRQVEALVRLNQDLPGNQDVKLQLAGAYSQLGQALQAQPERSITTPLEPYRQSIALREEVLAASPSDVVARRGLMISYSNLGELLYSPIVPSAGDVVSARLYAEKVVSLARGLLAADPNNNLARFDLANSLLRQGWLEPEADGLEESLNSLRQAEAILKSLREGDPASRPMIRALTQAQEYVGHRYRQLGHPGEALAAYQRSLDLAEKSLAEGSKDVNLPVQVILDEQDIAIVLAAEGNRKAIELAGKAIGQAELRMATAKDKDRAQCLIAAAWGKLAAVQQTLGDCQAAGEAGRKAIAVWNALAANGGRNSMETELAAARKVLRGCALEAR